ncbi:hypothetical protein SAMN05428988_0080 [Chitinophaga sp. YR573]|nr:hypothetical protein SAMN05428988_0080 [Chitinophaga sp. YR573]
MSGWLYSITHSFLLSDNEYTHMKFLTLPPSDVPDKKNL